MELFELTDILLPGDEALKAPPFSQAAGESLLLEQAALCQQVMAFLKGCCSDALNHNTPIDTDVIAKDVMNTIRQKDPALHERFREELLSRYLTSPQVLSALGESAEPLYPRGQTLPAMNLNRLEPVYERGPIWRSVAKEP